MSDYPITTEVKNQWITYRQNLRDITTSINTSDLVIVEVNGELEVGGLLGLQDLNNLKDNLVIK